MGIGNVQGSYAVFPPQHFPTLAICGDARHSMHIGTAGYNQAEKLQVHTEKVTQDPSTTCKLYFHQSVIDQLLGCHRSPYSLQLGPCVLIYNLLEIKIYFVYIL